MNAAANRVRRSFVLSLLLVYASLGIAGDITSREPAGPALSATLSCGDVNRDGRFTSSDALLVLRAAVEIQFCDTCLCDATGSNGITATDALQVLRRAVDIPVDLQCIECVPPVCGDSAIAPFRGVPLGTSVDLIECLLLDADPNDLAGDVEVSLVRAFDTRIAPVENVTFDIVNLGCDCGLFHAEDSTAAASATVAAATTSTTLGACNCMVRIRARFAQSLAEIVAAVDVADGDCGDFIGTGFVKVDGGVDEECDDGNTVSQDGCSAQCRLEPVIGGTTTTTTTTIAKSTTTTLAAVTTTTSLPGVTTTTLPTVPGPDPTTTAPALVTGATTPFAGATRFLYDGAGRVQFNVAPDAIDPARVAVMRGRVLARDGSPLAAVLIHILDHPAFGQTLSREDGAFDMVVNGGGPLVLHYAKSGLLAAQRQLHVPLQDYVTAPDVRLSTLDSEATIVDLAAADEITVARATSQTDEDGTRRATLLIEPGTSAQMIMSDGSTEPLTQLTVRATEYTVGSAGPELMPAVLPPQSGYTYAVEFSVDEAIAARASMVAFDRPIATYVENFLGFPAGTPVPAGYYDYVRGAWIAAPNGRVIDVVSVTGGLIDLDVTGDGVADSGTALSDLGIDDAERLKLATLYAAGTSLWRVPVDHFSVWDYNWPYGPPEDATSPAESGAAASSDDEPLDGSCEAAGSVIECENQVLGEEILLAGTPYTLNYRSDRVPGRLDSLDVRLSGASVPASLRSIRVRATVAGRAIDESFAPAPNQSAVFTWDGLDAYARPVQGGQRVTGTVEYVYPLTYKTASQFQQAFARFGGSALTVDRAAATVSASMPFTAALREGITDARGLGLGGWTLDVHHFYDPTTRVLHLGNGERRRADSVARVIDRVKLPVEADNSGTQFAIGPDGSIYTIHFGGSGSADTVIRRRTPDGVQSVFAGGGATNTPPFGEDGPALGATLLAPSGLAVGPDGLLYIMESSRVILRVDADGILRRVAGKTRFGNLGDPCPGNPVPEGAVATETDLCLRRITVANDGTIYFVERTTSRGRIRAIGSDGLITTIAGTANSCSSFGSDTCGDGGLAREARFISDPPGDLAAGADGSLYVIDNTAVRRIGPDGIIDFFAGQRRKQGFFGDGGPATDAMFCTPNAIAVGQDGAVYILDVTNGRLRRVAADGIVSSVAGSGTACDFSGSSAQSGDGGPALQAVLRNAQALAIAPDGEIFAAPFVGGAGGQIRRIGRPLPGFSDTDITVASQDGRSLYAFDPAGRHLRTLDALTGSVQREFGYDTDGRLTKITEKTGGTDNVTTIERDGSGRPTGIVGPFGRRTTLAVDGDGFLSSITNPAGETTALVSSTKGLLESVTVPGGRTSTFAYDEAGRLLRHDDAADGSQDLQRSGPPDAFSVTRTTALGRVTSFLVESLPDRTQRRTITAPDATEGVVVDNVDAATRTFTPSDGAKTVVTAGGDPRFGVEAPTLARLAIRLPSALEAVATSTRTATVSNALDPLSMTTLTETSSVAGNTYSTTYTAATRSFVTTTPLGRSRTLTLDALGRAVALQATGGVASTASYDARGRLDTLTAGSGPDARTFTLTYDSQGLPTSFTDPLARSVSMERDAAGRLIRKTLPDGAAIELDYDAAGDFTGITPPGRPAHTFAYGPRGELVTITPPAVAGTGPTTLAYDDDGELTVVARPGETVTFGYDSAGRPSTVALDVAGGAQGTYTLSYDVATGLVAGIAGPAGATLSYTYDGPFVTAVTWDGPVQGSVGITLDNRLAVASESVNGGSTVAFTHDADDHLIAAGELTIARDASTGLPASTALGVVSDAWTHDGFGELTAYSVTAGGTPLFAQSYDRDKLGRVTRRAETIGGETTTYDYAYDANGQLVEVTRDGDPFESYGYDANGNRIAANVEGASITASYDDQDRLLAYGATTFEHTPSGRIKTRTAGADATAYEHDAAGNLLAVTMPDGTEVAYVLDAVMRRVARDVDAAATERFLWAGHRPLAELDGTQTLVSRFVYAGGPAPAYLLRDGAAHRIITDHTGSVRLVINAVTGAVEQRLDYDSFGRVRLDTNPGFQPFGFAGGLYDRTTGLVQMGARDYDAVTGRWTSKDPIGFAGLDTNLYRYAGNDPVNAVDPDGLFAGEIVTGIVAGLVDLAMLPVSLAHSGEELRGALTESITGVPQVVLPDPNPVVRLLEFANSIAAAFGEDEPLVDTGSSAFEVSRICSSVLPTLGAGLAGGAARGTAASAGRAAAQSGAKGAGPAIARTAEEAYRPLVTGQAARAERLAAENAKRFARQEAKQAAQQAGERGRLQQVLSDGGGAGTRAANKPAGGSFTGR